MAKPKPAIKPGDTVLYRHTIMIGDGPENTGVVKALTPEGKESIATVRWLYAGLPSRVNVRHLNLLPQSVSAD